MPDFRAHPAARLLRSYQTRPDQTVSLQRVVRQRAAFAELYGVMLLEPALDAVLTEACRAAAEGCDAPFAKLLEHRPERHDFLVRAGIGWKPGVVGHAIVPDDASNPAGEALQTQRPVNVSDLPARVDYHLPPIYPAHGILSASNVPILSLSGFYGVLEVDRPDLRAFDDLDATFLMAVAGIVGDAVGRVRRESALQAAHDARAVLLREHHHRVRNNYQSLISQLEQHAREASAPDSQARFRDVQRRVFALAALYDHLVGAELSEGHVHFGRYLNELAERMRAFYALAERGITLDCRDGAAVFYDIDTVTAIGTVVNELVANAVEHGFAQRQDGRIEIRLEHGAAGPVLSVADDGTGFQEAASASVGLTVIERLIASVGGTMSRTAPGHGTVWTLTLPPPSGPA